MERFLIRGVRGKRVNDENDNTLTLSQEPPEKMEQFASGADLSSKNKCASAKKLKTDEGKQYQIMDFIARKWKL